MPGAVRTRKLKWRCRRGMKELDVLLERCVATHHETLNAGNWPELESMLQAEDDQLWDWLQNPTTPEAAGYRDLLEQIRHEPS